MPNSPYTLPTPGKPPARPPLRKIAIEEHFDHAAASTLDGAGRAGDIEAQARRFGLEPEWFRAVSERVFEFEEKRLAAMDSGHIDVSILSLTTPGVQGIADVPRAVAAAREINDFLAGEVIAKHPDRYAGFATLALQNPAEAARELERCVTRLGFKGALINGYTNTAGSAAGEYLDQPEFWPFWEGVEALNVPVYLHPRTQFEQAAYEGHRELVGATWGFGTETAMHTLRLVFGGVFDRFPKLTVILGHLGEMLPYFSWRIQHLFEHNPFGKKIERRLEDYLCENFYISTSGCWSDQALICALLLVGGDRLLFAVDYPYERMDLASEWLDRAPISENDRRKIAHGNARALFKL
ncbi:MAG TPA: amidohydrolase family protein [Bryobacteraceae bacterium]|nr:amidohydrolase family protein [Bryobacteraceae bacterium]